METISKIKKRRETMDEIQELAAKKAKIVENPELEKETMKITQLNDDCLKHIFAYLRLQDLLNISLSNTRFQHAADLACKQKHRNEQITMDFSRNLIIQIGEDNINREEFEIFVLIFGDLISSINFHAYPSYLKNVNTSHMPNMKSLELTMINPNYENHTNYTKIFLNHNLQIKTLKLDYYIYCYDWKLIESIAKESQIENLDIRANFEKHKRECIHFPKLKSFRFQNDTYRTDLVLPFTFDQLEKLTLNSFEFDNVKVKMIDEVIK